MNLSNAYVKRGLRRPGRLAGLSVLGVAATLGAASATASATVERPLSSTSRPARASGDVDVLSAGSLDTLITKKVAPAFHRATGYTLVDTSGGSGTLASDIKNKIDVADVFLSASPTVTKTLIGKQNGNWVVWYSEFADSPYVLGYDPKSTFAQDLRTMPWYKVITLPGFRVGRTNPTQDPGGVLAVKVLDEAAAKYHSSALTTLATESSDEYEEDTEEADIQNGQLDGSFMYEADANSQDSPYVNLSGVPTVYGDYTVSLVKNAPHRTAALAFVKFLLGPEGHALLKDEKFGVLSPPKTYGSYIPPSLKSVLK